MPESLVVGFAISCGTWLVMYHVCSSNCTSYRQLPIIQVTYFRLACAYLATLGSMPCFVIFTLSALGFVSGDHHLALVMATLMNLSSINGASTIPISVSGKRIRLPLVTDPPLLERVGTIAKSMEIETPLVRLLPSAGGEQLMMAFAVMLPAPELVVSDGIMHRMQEIEESGIIGHELAHLANHSLWMLAAVGPLGTLAFVVGSCWMPMEVAFPFGFAVMTGLYRVVSRLFEFDCDRRAARIVGHGPVMSALAKVHAGHPLSDSGLFSLLVYSMATHPSRNTRLAQLWPEASEDDRRRMPPNIDYVRWELILSRVFLAIWLTALTVALVVTAAKMEARWLQIPLWTVALTPTLLLLCCNRKVRIAGARKKTLSIESITKRRPVVLLIGSLLGLFATFLVFHGALRQSEHAPWILGVWFLALFAQLSILAAGLIFYIWRAYRISGVRVRIDHAMQLHHFRTVLEICEAHPGLLRRSPALRHNQALAMAAAGDRSQAIRMFRQLWLDHPDYQMAGVILNILLLESNQPEEALQIALQLSTRLEGDAGIKALVIRSLLRLDRIDEADQICREAIARNPEDSRLFAPAAEVALSLRQLDQAEKQIHRALEVAPGFPPFLLTMAKIHLKCGRFEEARSVIGQVMKSAASNPFLFLDPEIEFLKSELVANDRPEKENRQ